MYSVFDDIQLWICRNCNTYWHCNLCPFCARPDCRFILSDDQMTQLLDAVSLINVDDVDDVDNVDDIKIDDSYKESFEYKQYQFCNEILSMLPWYVPSRLMIQACWFSLYLKKSVDPNIEIAMEFFKREYQRISVR
jgi:hypothetical protein